MVWTFLWPPKAGKPCASMALGFPTQATSARGSYPSRNGSRTLLTSNGLSVCVWTNRIIPLGTVRGDEKASRQSEKKRKKKKNPARPRLAEEARPLLWVGRCSYLAGVSFEWAHSNRRTGMGILIVYAREPLPHENKPEGPRPAVDGESRFDEILTSIVSIVPTAYPPSGRVDSGTRPRSRQSFPQEPRVTPLVRAPTPSRHDRRRRRLGGLRRSRPSNGRLLSRLVKAQKTSRVAIPPSVLG
ncbi:uncharacterized protein LY79DRAFT_559765 [Colletotrichum navitas]|uniref:Uncharacterized protein n=1 Tax=Colletotrichum navitas TaxID=681940 RepID=A0AAD8PUV6_9PEZI|nr:uncharacterized protein LY79DRAFT_559765 [Colletotrichum navitas]KAK1584922.1 hypothetical protein LY79DRAFT_559765 [Colletotrichum navitas]